jgi:exodeoxyribonuclease-3
VRITTWNINSVRLRIELVRQLSETVTPDVLCLQETKVADDLFPSTALAEMGYSYQAINGNKNYHGVAVLSRLPFEAVTSREWCGKADGRHLQVTLPGGIELHNFYVPSGGDVPDPAVNDKFDHKLKFLAEMKAWSTERADPAARRILVGDLNVAPLETDVWSHKQLLKVVSHTPVEVEAFNAVQASADWQDAVRAFVPAEEKLYSWWSYRARDWRAADRGRRLDHVWVSPGLRPALAAATIAKDARGWTQPSDHVPVTVDLTVDMAI